MLKLGTVRSIVGVVVLAVCGLWLGSSSMAVAAKATGVTCTIDMVVETMNNSGTVVSTESYQNSFVLQDGDLFSDDFSTVTRFKFFNAGMSKANGESIVTVDWFADVTVFNAVDFNSTVVLSGNQKVGKTIGEHTFYTSGSATRTKFSLVCNAN